jgi:hypothetical protein
MGQGLSWQPAKRGSAFSEADDRSWVARRSKATVRSGPDPMGTFRAGAGRLPQGTCRWTGCWQASGPFARFISRASSRCCAFRSARERCWNSTCRAFRHNAVGGGWKERSAEKRDADARGPGGRGSERKYGRLSVGCGRFRRTSLQPAWIARRQQRGLRRRPVLRGRDGHCRSTTLQDAEAVRRWQGRGECVLSGQTGPSEASGVPG